MTYDEALQYIHSVSWKGSRPGLERTQELLKKLGNPENTVPCIHVAGTNGKGSFCAMCSSVLTSAGYRTGRYISPFIRRFNERMSIDGEEISDEELADITADVKPFADSMTDCPTEFELITVIAFVYFARHRCEIVVLETGMGGRLDSTNVIQRPVLSVITGIAMDHMAYLGNTIQQIAFEKAGIIKPGCPILWGGEDKSAAVVIQKKAEMENAPLFTADFKRLSVSSSTLEGADFSYRARQNLHIPLAGLYQPVNAALVLDAVDILCQLGWRIPDDALRAGLAATRWNGRFEVLCRNPLVISDGGHNPQGIDAAIRTVKAYFNTKILLLTGVMADKDYRSMALQMASIAQQVFTVTPDNSRALDSACFADVFREMGIPAQSFETVAQGVLAGMAAARETGLPLLCLGSLYMYGAIAKAVGGDTPVVPFS